MINNKILHCCYKHFKNKVLLKLYIFTEYKIKIRD